MASWVVSESPGERAANEGSGVGALSAVERSTNGGRKGIVGVKSPQSRPMWKDGGPGRFFWGDKSINSSLGVGNVDCNDVADCGGGE